VFLDIVQEVSSASNVPDNCNPTERNCNPRISTKKLSTEAAVQSGDTIMLAGLITDSGTDGSSGIPGLSRIPVVGALFGQKSRTSRRSE
ncbi:type II secretion system protein GspD, partial [Pseudomonas syringae pv. tagetis]